MALVNINWKPTTKELRSFALLWTPLFLLGFAALTWWRADFVVTTTVIVLAAIVVVTALLGAVFPAAIRPLFIALMVVTFPIGFVISHILLGFLYYGVFTPIGLLLRLSGRDSMGLKIDKNATSYFTKHVGPRDPASYFKQF
jgi:hypothetical protein